MTTAQTKSNPITDNFEAAAGRVTELNEKAVETGKKASIAYLSSYEKVVLQLADGYEKAAEASRLEWFTAVAPAQADFAREVTKVYNRAAREVVQA